MPTHRVSDHLWILLTVALATYSQLILRWQMSNVGALPAALAERLLFVISIALKPWVLSALIATFLSGLSWMVVLSKFELSYAFPFTALNFLVIMLAGVWLLNESLSPAKVVGTLVVMGGVLIIATSHAGTP